MRKPLLATKSVTLVHCIRQGTGSTSYTTVLSGVSCREVAAAGTGAQSGAGPGFAPKSSSEICVFVGHSTAAPQSGTAASMDAASNLSRPCRLQGRRRSRKGLSLDAGPGGQGDTAQRAHRHRHQRTG